MLTMETLVKDMQDLSYQHWQGWKGRGLDLNDLEEKAVDWAWPKFEKLAAMYALSPIAYKRYTENCVKRLLNRFCQEEIVRSVSFVSSDRSDNKVGSGRGYTYFEVKTALEKKDDTVFLMAEKACTGKQLEAIVGLYLGEMKPYVLGPLLGVSAAAVYRNVDRAIHNIVSYSMGWDIG